MKIRQVVTITMSAVLVAGSCLAEPGMGGGRGNRPPVPGRGRMDRPDGHKGGMHHQSGIDRLINNKNVQKRLNLTDEQIERLKDVRNNLAEQRKELMQEMHKVRKEQMELMRSDKLNKKAIMQKVNELGKLRTKMEKLRIKQLFAVNDILTDEQLAQVKKRMRERMEKMKQHRKNNMHKQGKKGPRRGRPDDIE